MNTFPTRVADGFGGQYVIEGSIKHQWKRYWSLTRLMHRLYGRQGWRISLEDARISFYNQHGEPRSN